MKLVFWSILLLCCQCVTAVAIDPRFDTLIPYPRELAAYGDPVSLESYQILVGPSPEASIGAKEVNQRIESLGGVPLPVETLGRSGIKSSGTLSSDDLPSGNLLIIVTHDAPSSVLKSFPGKTPEVHDQGYVVRPEKQPDGSLRLWLVGTDPQGTLYAAVSARQLIQTSQDHSIQLRPATITDWPDYKDRQIGQPMSEPRRGLWYAMKEYESQGEIEKAKDASVAWILRKKAHYDWMLRAKINWAWSSSFLKAESLQNQTTVARSALNEMNRYGIQRGIRTMVTSTTSVGNFPKDKDNPDFADVAYHSTHHRYFCWSRLKYHEEKAKIVAEMVADCGYRGLYVHAADGGGWRNPGLWNDRCEQCRKTYGDDHAKADATVFRIYYDAVRKRVPDCEFVAVVYPYSPEQLDADLVYQDVVKEMGPGKGAREVAEQRTSELTTFVQRLDSLLPQDILVTVREAERTPMNHMRSAWGKRRFHMYYEYAYWKGWQPYFTTTPLWTKSLYYSDHDDMLFGNMSGYGWRELQELLGAECAWNVNRPGSKDFSEAGWKGLGTRVAPPPERRTFASRASRYWFGEKMGPLLSPVFAENISHEFIAFPDRTLERTNIADPLATMLEQAAATKRAADSLDKAHSLQQSNAILEGEDLGFFLNMLMMTHGAAITSAHRAHVMQIEDAINRGDRKNCVRLITNGKDGLKIAAKRWVSIYDGIPKKQLMKHYRRRRNAHAYLSTLDFEEFEQELNDLSASYSERMIARTMPKWFVKNADRRHVRAIQTIDKINVDGQLGEATWTAARSISNFLYRDRMQLDDHITQAQLAFDPSNLYATFQCREFAAKDWVSILIASHKGAKTVHSWYIRSDGRIAPAKSKATAKYSTQNGIWTAEIAIPLTELDFKVMEGRSCVIQLARRSKLGTVTYGFAHGEPLDTLKHFSLMDFTGESQPPAPIQVGLNLETPTLHHETIGTGAGSVIAGNLSVLSDSPLHQVSVSVEIKDGVRSLSRKNWITSKRVPLIWRPDKGFVMRFPEEIPGVIAHFKVQASEGEWTFTRRFGSPHRPKKSPADLYTRGIGKGQALNHPIHFASPGPDETPWSEGTLEFWIQPNWRYRSGQTGPRGQLDHALMHMGPIRPDHPTLYNHNSLALIHSASGYLTGALSSSRYRYRGANASVRDWQAGDWHHVAMQWQLNDASRGGITTVQIYLDGIIATEETDATPRETAKEPLMQSKFLPPIQMGSMNTGLRPADAAIDELRISSTRRYTADFEPTQRLESDQDTLALFHFDGDLESDGGTGIKAVVGAAQ